MVSVTDPRRGLTLIEITVAMAVGLVLLATAASAMRVSMQTITKANRLSLENRMLRLGIVGALNEADFWTTYDDLYDNTKQPLRGASLPFNESVVINRAGAVGASGAATLVTPDLSLVHRPETWWRGMGYYDTYQSPDPKDLISWGDYGLVSKMALATMGTGSEPVGAVLPNALHTMVTDYGLLAAYDTAPAHVLWKWQDESPYGSPDFPDYFKVNHNAMFTNHNEGNMAAGDRQDSTWLGAYVLSAVDNDLDPSDGYDDKHLRHVWWVPRLVDGEARGQTLGSFDSELKEMTSNWARVQKMFAKFRDTRAVVAASQVPEDWPRLGLQRATWFYRGTTTYWIRIALTDPLTGRQLALSIDGAGTTFRGARMQRAVVNSGRRF